MYVLYSKHNRIKEDHALRNCFPSVQNNFKLACFVLINNNSKPKEKIKNKQLLKPIDNTIFSIL